MNISELRKDYERLVKAVQQEGDAVKKAKLMDEKRTANGLYVAAVREAAKVKAAPPAVAKRPAKPPVRTERATGIAVVPLVAPEPVVEVAPRPANVGRFARRGD